MSYKVLSASIDADIYTVEYRRKKNFAEKLGSMAQSSIDQLTQLVSN